MVKEDWKTGLIVVLAVVVGILLAQSGILSSKAYAQSEGQAPGVICVLGYPVNGYAPIVLVDVPDQTLIVYEYSYGSDTIELTAARTYRFDRRLKEFNIEGPSVADVMKEVAR
ncbi:MAG: hypothetical protein KAX80_03445 [Planctomycetes bacterium]|nr:hypothetical protein [Planctomycetota bacterium]